MSDKTKGILLAFGLLALAIVTFQQDLIIQEVESLTQINSKNIREMKTSLDLSVLDSCGIITDGYSFGSCVAITPDLLLTAGHCIGNDGSWIEVQGVRYEIVEEWISEIYDIGFVLIDGTLPYVELGNIPELLDEVYLVGSPYNTELVNTITKGIISHLDRDMHLGNDMIQTDAEGAPGSSGGPLLNTSGQIVGIYVVYYQPGGGVSLCVSVEAIREAYEKFLSRA